MLYNFFTILYSLGIHIASIFNNKAKLWVKGRVDFPKLDLKQKTIWVHCASLGEFEQGKPVLEAIKNKYPKYPSRNIPCPINHRMNESLLLDHPLSIDSM